MLVSDIIHTLNRLAIQRRYLRRHIKPLLVEAKQRNDGSLNNSDFKKINHYYGLAVPAVLGESFCAWQGRKMTDRERACSTGQGAMTGLFDDFFDRNYLDDTYIGQLMQVQESVDMKSNEQLFRRFYRMALEQSPDMKAVQQTLSDVYAAQVLSRKQSGGQLTMEQIREITLQKGGSSLLFYRTAFTPEADQKERNMLFRLGGLMQLSNDIFDVYKDREAGIETLVTTATEIKPLANWFRQHLYEEIQEAMRTAGSPSQGKKFLSILCMSIFSRVMVCLEQLEKLETESGGTFDIHAYNRKELICDMEKPANLLRAARYYRDCMKRAKTG